MVMLPVGFYCSKQELRPTTSCWLVFLNLIALGYLSVFMNHLCPACQRVLRDHNLISPLLEGKKCLPAECRDKDLHLISVGLLSKMSYFPERVVRPFSPPHTLFFVLVYLN